MAFSEPTPSKEKLAVISGETIKMENQKSHEMTKEQIKGHIQYNGELQTRFEEFAKTHDIIDWHVIQDSHSSTWRMFIRYKP